MEKQLTPKQERFCQEYLVDSNGTQSAIRAGYSEKTANEQASGLLAKINIQARVNELRARQSERTQINADRILEELYKLATVDVSQAYDDSGWLKQLKDIPEDVRRSMSGLETNELFQGQGDDKSIIGVNKKVRFYDKTKALELLGKHLKLFADRIEHSGPNGKPIEHKNLSEVPSDEIKAEIERLLTKRAAT